MDIGSVNENNINAISNKLQSVTNQLKGNWAIYGTGDGAEIVYEALKKINKQQIIAFFVDRDDYLGNNVIHNKKVKKLNEIVFELDGIIIGAAKNHKLIFQRINNYLLENKINNLIILDIFKFNSALDKEEYIKYIEKSILKKSDTFVEFNPKKFIRNEYMVKAIAWYLPQFHQMEINDKFHGKGFTEWTNTTMAIPVFTGHYQPHIPYDVGYYDLLNKESMKIQIYLAKHYGIYGFCVHYYWFSGKRIMERPLQLLLENKDLDIPFCLDWATENWTALWDGGNKEVMLEQTIEEEDAERFMLDILPYMNDKRYIKICNKPVLIIYRINIFVKKKIRKLLKKFREIAKLEGFDGLYIMVSNAFSFIDDVREWGADAIVEFPPHAMMDLMEERRPFGYINTYYNGTFNDANDFIREKRYMIKHQNNRVYFRSAMTAWDNTARKAISDGKIIWGLTPDTYKQWLKDIIEESYRIHPPEENIVFLNSWNEWAEGSHLEPDMKYGYAYLQETRDAIEETARDYIMT